MRSLASAILGAALAIGLSAAASGQDACQGRVNVALVLALDNSSSMKDDGLAEKQKWGYVQAFRDPRVGRAILATECGVAAWVFRWSDWRREVDLIPWRILNSEAAIAAFVDELGRIDVSPTGKTSLAGVMRHGRDLLRDERMPFTATRKIINVSGNGSDSDDEIANLVASGNGRVMRAEMYPGYPLARYRADALAEDITVNVLPLKATEGVGNGIVIDLVYYYQNNVAGGPGAFSIVVEESEDYANAITRKLMTEIAAR